MLGPGQARSLDSRAEQWEVIELEKSVHHLAWCLRDPAGGRGLTGLQEGGMGTGDPGTELTLIPACCSPLPSRPARGPANSALHSED